jgi:Clr5 domain
MPPQIPIAPDTIGSRVKNQESADKSYPRHSGKEWDDHKGRFERHYAEEQGKLKKVASIMELRYGFRARWVGLKIMTPPTLTPYISVSGNISIELRCGVSRETFQKLSWH